MPSRLYLWQLKKISEGKCANCGKPRGQDPRWCSQCLAKKILLKRTASYLAYARDHVLKRSRTRVAEGRCMTCNGPLEHYNWHCDKCEVERRKRARKVRGSKPWSGWGRKPVIPD